MLLSEFMFSLLNTGNDSLLCTGIYFYNLGCGTAPVIICLLCLIYMDIWNSLYMEILVVHESVWKMI